MFDSDLEVDVLALQSLSSSSDLMGDLPALGGGGASTCFGTNVCILALASLQVAVCCNTNICENTVCNYTIS